MKNKILLSMTSATLMVAPIATIISCGSNRDKKTIRFAMRAEDFVFWQPIIDEYTKKTGIKVEKVIVTNQKNDYATWASTGGIPDVSLADQNTIKSALKKNEWFTPIDLKDLKDKKYDVDKSQPEFDILKSETFFQSTLTGFWKDKANNKVLGVPYGYGAQGIYVNEELVDSSKNIFAYVPNDDGTFAKKDTNLKATMLNINNFIKTASVSNDTTNGEITDATFKNKGWEDVGPLALYQRIASIGLSATKTSATTKAGWIKDVGFPFEVVASLKDIYANNQIDDDKLKEKFPKTNASDSIIRKLYKTYYGYFQKDETNGSAKNPKALGTPGEADSFWAGHGSIMMGYKWQLGMIKSNWYKHKQDKTQREAHFDNNVKVLSTPYGSIGVDSLALSETATGVWKDNALKFIKFALSKKAFEITHGKVISPVKSAKTKQISNIDNSSTLSAHAKARQKAFFNSGNNSEIFNGLSGGIMSISSKGIYDIFEGKISSQFKPWLTESGFDKVTFSNLKSKLATALNEVYKEIKIRG